MIRVLLLLAWLGMASAQVTSATQASCAIAPPPVPKAPDVSSLPANYVTLSAAAKMDVIWNLTKAQQYTSNPLPRSVLSDAPLSSGTFLAGAFDQSVEEMPTGRQKVVGTNGIVAKANMIIYPNSTYTGMFAANQNNTGIMRYSSNTAANLVSYWAFKIFVDGNYSQHLHMIHDVNGWGVDTVDYFTFSFQTAIPAPLPEDYAAGRYVGALDKSFADALCSLPGGPLDRPANNWALGNVEQARVNVKNQQTQGQAIAPFIIQVTPNPALRPLNVNVHTDDWRVVVGNNLPVGTKLFTVTAKKTPCDDYDTIGEVWVRSEWVASAYNDKVMRFGQPAIQWDYSVAAPGSYCSIDPMALTTWPSAESNQMEQLANGSTQLAYGNTPAAVVGAVPSAGVPPAGSPVSTPVGSVPAGSVPGPAG